MPNTDHGHLQVLRDGLWLRLPITVLVKNDLVRLSDRQSAPCAVCQGVLGVCYVLRHSWRIDYIGFVQHFSIDLRVVHSYMVTVSLSLFQVRLCTSCTGSAEDIPDFGFGLGSGLLYGAALDDHMLERPSCPVCQTNRLTSSMANNNINPSVKMNTNSRFDLDQSSRRFEASLRMHSLELGDELGDLNPCAAAVRWTRGQIVSRPLLTHAGRIRTAAIFTRSVLADIRVNSGDISSHRAHSSGLIAHSGMVHTNESISVVSALSAPRSRTLHATASARESNNSPVHSRRLGSCPVVDMVGLNSEMNTTGIDENQGQRHPALSNNAPNTVSANNVYVCCHVDEDPALLLVRTLFGKHSVQGYIEQADTVKVLHEDSHNNESLPSRAQPASVFYAAILRGAQKKIVMVCQYTSSYSLIYLLVIL